MRFWMSSQAMTIAVTTDDNKIITKTPPIARKFIGQPLINLANWMNTQGYLRVEQMDIDEDNPGSNGSGTEEY